jgi:ABC-type multidrug transport system fused ATPase/permease subunit
MAEKKAVSTRPFREVFSAGWSLLTPAERRRGAWLTAAQVVQSALDAVAMSAVLPLVGVLVQPDVVQTNAYARRLYALLGAPSHERLVIVLALGAFALVAARSIVSIAVEHVRQQYAASCQDRLAHELLVECVNAPYPWFLTRNASLLARLFYDDVSQWSRGFVQRLMSILSDATTALFGTALLLVFTPVLGLIVMTSLAAVAYGLMSLTRRRLARLSMEKRVALEGTLMAASQALVGIKDVKLSSREGYFVRLFDRAYHAASHTHARLNVWHQVVPMTLPVVGLAGVLAIVLLQVQLGRSRGEIAAQTALLLLVSSRIVPSISQLSSSVGLLWNAAPYVDALYDLRTSIAAEAARRPRLAIAAAPWSGEWKDLSLVRVGFSYPRAQAPALRDITLSIEAGRAYGLAGPSGAGKSTLVDLILRLLDPSEGALRLDGNPIEAVDVRAWQAQIGYVPQAPFMADDTLRANVAFGVPREQVDDVWVLECLKLAHLESVLAELEQGLDTRLGDRGLRLSGGQRQRIAIARALYGRPRLLVLDEATSALDRISEGAIQQAIEGLRGRVTSLTIAHRLATIERCDAIFLFEEGRLAAQGTYDELLAQNALFRRMASERAEPAPALAHNG